MDTDEGNTMESDGLNELRDAIAGRFFGKYRGVVVDTADPQQRGRLKVQVPAVMGEQAVWALPCAVYAGDGVGLFALPKAGTVVWVEFEAGDANFPIWVGCFWTSGQVAASDAVEGVKFLKTDSVSIRVDDEVGEVVIETAGGAKLSITATEIKLDAGTVTQVSGATKTTVSAAGFDVSDGAFSVV